MQQLFSLWDALDARRRIIVAVATAAVFALVLMLAKVAGNPSMSLLYSGLEPAVSGEVVSALEQRGVGYKVQGNTIFVDASQRDLVRMALAEQGLPATGSAGYELLDNLSGFGTTAQMFDAAYWRAKEGELARTILAWPQVKSARVHLAIPVQRPFSQAAVPVASVTLRMSAGALSADRSRALRFLIASAVAGLAPDDVSVIDSDRGLVAPAASGDSVNGQASSRAMQLKHNIERLLIARVGAGNAVVEVSLDVTQDQEKIVEHRFDPDSRVAISTDTEELTGSSSGNSSGAVTVASNLPDGDGANGGGSSRNSSSETRERINYEVSETTRELIRQPGKINRLTVAVLVNGVTEIAGDGSSSWTPRSEEELTSLRQLVESAVGYDETRGDVVTLKTLEFQPLPEEGTTASASLFSGIFANSASILQSGVLAVVILGLGMFVVRPVLMAQPVPALPTPEILTATTAELNGPDSPVQIAFPSESSLEDAPEELDPIAQLRQIISERQDETVEVLRNWIETSEEPVG